MTMTCQEAINAIIPKLARYGLDASMIAQDGISEEGYFAYLKQGEDPSQRIIRGDGVAKVWTEWPAGFPYEEFQPLIQRIVLP